LTSKPAASNSARWFSQLGSLIQTLAEGCRRFREIGPDLQAAGAAQALERGDATGRDQRGIFAEQQLLHRNVIGGYAFDGQVAARRGALDTGFFGLAHGGEQGILPLSS
jgi:hypothetical protein